MAHSMPVIEAHLAVVKTKLYTQLNKTISDKNHALMVLIHTACLMALSDYFLWLAKPQV